MSDFDKEAEREKLREKYERDREKRQSTQVMSDLLLKGATMTNRHCDSCGDPIFRYDGQEFCPTCQRSEADEGASEPSPGDGDEVDETATDHQSTASGGVGADGVDQRKPSPGASGPSNDPGRGYPSDSVDPSPVDGGLSEAHDSLVRTVVKFSRAAESTDDPRRAREALSAAREAAETLEALRR
ncbi:Sjogren's syndrome/scleroderma autoantigen 1 family protein [Halalkaliarchaeum sp. AArc-GB]|uniref:Sjogren's syndrome/scleroderma autoantigen 1 family protein n=1 Tax=Halalkaliarchaeum sp. AArc-GB TaxID=3074078 RepID=UPI0028651BAD|nr:Sjogren's syndrome/scleroderma autoantigen 1 family protein [Halalkaliarchaeum sp. AArc-GB]MDR5671851.1 Sjogren's syndrome/scleroderma autoantigen 1 family protein [Halalkaliarchaeum sp. AArc-GB]